MAEETMLRRSVIASLTISLIGIACMAAMSLASADDVRVANAAMKGDKDAVRALLKQAADVNAAQGDGMTALHWAAINGDSEMAQILLYAGANVRAATRIGGYSPLFMAAKSGAPAVVTLLLKAGADAKHKAGDGLTPLMMASMAGDKESVRLLIEHGADVNGKETENGQTPLIFAASFDRADVIEELVKHGADVNIGTPVRPPAATRSTVVPPVPGQPPQPQQQQQQPPQQDANSRGGGNPRGGLTPLMYASRDGNAAAVRALVKSGAKLNLGSADRSTALLLATINGHFDVAKYLVENHADVNIVSADGAAPLYSVVHTQWSRQSFHPQPSIKWEQTTYLDLMKLMLDEGADPNARLTKTLWYSSYGYVYAAASEIGTTAFFKCAEVADIDGMKLLLSRGADPNLTNKDGVNAVLIASGAGTHGNDDVLAAYGRLEAVKYLVEKLHFDVNSADNGTTFRGEITRQAQPPDSNQQQPQQQQPNPFGGMAAGGFTALHNAASRGDNEMILYLVSRGADVNATTKTGITVVDMANGPRQRVQPYPDTIALLEMLGARNSHKCVSC
jgi:uncharacterized protein